MEPSATSRPPASEPPRTDADETFFKTPDAPPGRHYKQVIMPGVASSPILPERLSAYFRKLFGRKDTPVSR